MSDSPLHDEIVGGDSAETTAREGIVGEVIDNRTSVYGDPIESYTRIAQVWSGILGFEVQPYQVVLCMIGTKSVRASITPNYSDNSDDIEGYLDMFRTIIGDDMIIARLTSEYLEKLALRAELI